MSDLPKPQNKIKETEDESDEKKAPFLPGSIDFSRALAVALVLLACFVGWILVTDGADILHRLVRHIMALFRGARIDPYPNEKFIQLLLITVFVGWAINRFRKKK